MKTNKEFPTVSILSVVRNEMDCITRSVSSLLAQDYPKDSIEIIFVDGMSDDGTREWLENTVTELKKSGTDIKFLDNPKKILAAGWNIGVQSASGDVIIRVDGHAVIPRDFVRKNIEVLSATPEAKVAGGIVRSEGKSWKGKAIAALFSSSFGVGNSIFRVGTKSRFVDTIALGAFKKEVYHEIGYYNERLLRGQDLEFHNRLRAKGYKIYFSPEISCTYFYQDSFRGLAKKAFVDGLWNIDNIKFVRIRHIVPFIFVSSLITLGTAGFFSPICAYSFLTLLGTYVLADAMFSAYIAAKTRFYYFFALIWLFPLFHFSYGLGSVYGLLKFLFKGKTTVS